MRFVEGICWDCGMTNALTYAVLATGLVVPISAYITNVTPINNACSPSDSTKYTSGTYKVTSQADADALSDCQTIEGDVGIQGDNITAISLPETIYQINGDLNVLSCSQLSRLSATGLQLIAGSFTLSNLPLLETIELATNGTSNENLNWNLSPLLYNVSSQMFSNNMTISNTGLQNLNFLNTPLGSKDGESMLDPKDTILIQNNPYLQSINISLTSFSFLEITNNSGVTDVGFPLLGELEGTITISNNSINAFYLPNLRTFSAFSFTHNDAIQSLSLPNVTDFTYWVTIENNPQLQTINLPELRSIGGNADISGNLTRISAPALITIGGNFSILSTAPKFDCSFFDQMEYTYVKYEYWKSVNYSCKAIAPNTTKDVAVHWHPPFHLRKGAKIAIIVLASVIGLLAAAFFVRWMGKWDERRMARIRAQREREDGERLPGYRRVGKPGEVPPGYSGHEMEGMDLGTESSRASQRVESTGGGGNEQTSPGAGLGEEVLGVLPHYDAVGEGDETPDLPPIPREGNEGVSNAVVGVEGVVEGEGQASAGVGVVNVISGEARQEGDSA